MIISELIWWLEKAQKEYGDVNVCVFADYLGGPSETIIPEFHENEEYFTICEEIHHGDFLFLS